jgi:hypothetical protein
MTISSRTRTFRFALFVTFAAIAAWVYIFIVLMSNPKALHDVVSLFGFSASSQEIPFDFIYKIITTCIGALYSAIILGIMSFAYSKTISPELFFFASWTFAQVFETVHIAIIYGMMFDPSAVPLYIIESRIVLIAHYFGIFSFFCMGLYAAGFRNDRFSIMLLAIFILALSIGTALPVDTGRFSPSFTFDAGYGPLQSFFEAATIALTIINFVYSWISRGEKTYGIASFGVVCTALGMTMIKRGMTPVGISIGIVLLAIGALLVMKPLHSYYLWQ